MKIKFTLIVFSFVFAYPIFAQPIPRILWNNVYGDTYNSAGRSVVENVDGGFTVAGHNQKDSYPDPDVYLLRLDADGDTLWTKHYGGYWPDYGYGMDKTSDGGYIIAGSTQSFNIGNVDIYLVKTDSDGDTVWTRSFGDDDMQYAVSVCQCIDGGYILAGVGYDGMFLLKTDADGNQEWLRPFTQGNWIYGYAAIETMDGCYVIVGETTIFGSGAHVYLVKTNAVGDVLWENIYNTFSGKGYNLVETADGCLAIVGNRVEYSDEVLLLKTDADGNFLWYQDLGGDYADEGYGIDVTYDGGYIISGHSNSYSDGQQVYILRTDPLGNEIWHDEFAFSAANADNVGYDIIQTSDSGFAVAGKAHQSGAFRMFVTRYGPEFTPSLSLTLTPINPPIEIPANGGSFEFNFEVVNDDSVDYTMDIWTMVMTPVNHYIGPILFVDNFLIENGQAYNRNLTQIVPASAPPGIYNYEAFIGVYPNVIIVEDQFQFQKMPF